MKKGIYTTLFFMVLTFISLLSVRAEYEPLAIVSDSHIGLNDAIYKTVIGKLDEQGIKKIIHAGDAINKYGADEQWKEFLMMGEGRVLMLAPGNHDIRSIDSYRTFLKFFPEPYHSVSDGDTLFVLLNTSMPGEEHRIAGDQLKWLRNELHRPFRYKFVFLHEPLYPVIPFHGIDRHRSVRDALHLLFVENNVSVVVAGHDHYYKRMQKNGIKYIVMGATGGRLGVFEHNGNFFSYVLARRINDGYAFTVWDLKGNKRDEFSVDSNEDVPGESVSFTSPVNVSTSSLPRLSWSVAKYLRHAYFLCCRRPGFAPP